MKARALGVALPKMDISLFFLIFFSTCFFLISWADQNFGCTKIDTHRLGDGGGGVLFGVFFIYATARSWMDVFLRVMFIWFLYAPISMLSLFAWLQNN